MIAARLLERLESIHVEQVGIQDDTIDVAASDDRQEIGVVAEDGVSADPQAATCWIVIDVPDDLESHAGTERFANRGQTRTLGPVNDAALPGGTTSQDELTYQPERGARAREQKHHERRVDHEYRPRVALEAVGVQNHHLRSYRS